MIWPLINKAKRICVEALEDNLYALVMIFALSVLKVYWTCVLVVKKISTLIKLNGAFLNLKTPYMSSSVHSFLLLSPSNTLFWSTYQPCMFIVPECL